MAYNSSNTYFSTSNKSWTITKISLMLITLLITMVTFLYSKNIVMAFSLVPYAPIMQITSLYISNVTVTNTKLAAIWDASFTIYNPNIAVKINMARFDSSIFYREDNVLSITSVDGFELSSREQRNVNMKFVTSGYEGDQPVVEYPVIWQISEDIKSGMVHFTMRMNTWATYETGWLKWTRRVVINPYCLDLDVGVVSDTGTGTMIGGDSNYCHVLMILAD